MRKVTLIEYYLDTKERIKVLEVQVAELEKEMFEKAVQGREVFEKHFDKYAKAKRDLLDLQDDIKAIIHVEMEQVFIENGGE